MPTKSLVCTLACAATLLASAQVEAQPVTLAEAARTAGEAAGTTASVTGTVALPDGTFSEGVMVRLRDVNTGGIIATAFTNAAGQFAIQGIGASAYILEVLDLSGNLLSVSTPFAVGVGEAVATFARVIPATQSVGSMLTNAATSVMTSASSLGVTAMAPTGPPASPEQ